VGAIFSNVFKNIFNWVEEKFGGVVDYVSNKFDFTFLAKDEERDASGEVIPGIGGNVYHLLGFKDQRSKNRYTPRVVLERMSL